MITLHEYEAFYHFPHQTTSQGRGLPNLLNELVFGERGLESLDLVALLGQDIFSCLIDIFEKQNFDVLGVEGLQKLGGWPLGKSSAGSSEA